MKTRIFNHLEDRENVVEMNFKKNLGRKREGKKVYVNMRETERDAEREGGTERETERE